MSPERSAVFAVFATVLPDDAMPPRLGTNRRFLNSQDVTVAFDSASGDDDDDDDDEVEHDVMGDEDDEYAYHVAVKADRPADGPT